MSFTPKGLSAIKAILAKYREGERFYASDIGYAGGTLTALAKDGYLIREQGKKISYYYTSKEKAKTLNELPKEFSEYTNEEFFAQTKMSYAELVAYCKDKYGAVTGNYFCTEEMRSENPKIKRGSEGLYIHHIYEDRAVMLGNPLVAHKHPWEYQEGKNLVYCNIAEHLLLHIAIVEEMTIAKIKDYGCFPGVGGAVNFIIENIKREFVTQIRVNKTPPVLGRCDITTIFEHYGKWYAAFKESELFPIFEEYKQRTIINSITGGNEI